MSSRKKSRSRSRRKSGGGKYLLLLLLAVVTVGLVIVALNRPPTPSEAATRSNEPRATPVAEQTTEPIKAVFIGDSWIGGAGLEESGPTNSYGGRAAAALGWDAIYLTGGGTGYTRGNDTGEGPFIDRAQAAIDAAPDVVIVQGSSNDYQASSATIEAAANDLFATLRAGLPDAKIYVVGVSDSPSAPVAAMNTSRAAVEKAATANGATFINSNGWLDQATDFADGYHPNEAGHQKVADQLVAAVSAG